MRDALAALALTAGVGAKELAKRAMWSCSSGLSARGEWQGGGALNAAAMAAGGAAGGAGTAARRAAEAAAEAQAAAAANAPGGQACADAAWKREAEAAAAALEPSECGGVGGAAVLGKAWAALAPACRRYACEELRKLIASETRQRERQQRTIASMPPALLLLAPPPSLRSARAEAHPSLEGLYFLHDFVSEAEEAALIEWCDAAPWQPNGAPTTTEWEVSHWNAAGAGNEGKAWGANTRSGANGRLAVPKFDPLPVPLLKVAERIATVAPSLLEHGTWRPNQSNAISCELAGFEPVRPH